MNGHDLYELKMEFTDKILNFRTKSIYYHLNEHSLVYERKSQTFKKVIIEKAFKREEDL